MGFPGGSVVKNLPINVGDLGWTPGSRRSPGEGIGWLSTPVFMGFLGSSYGEESTCNVEDLGSIPGLGRSPREGHGNRLEYSCLENPHGQRSLAGYSPWGRKESNTTERLNTTTKER